MSAPAPRPPAPPGAPAELAGATARLQPPYAVVHLPSLPANAGELGERVCGLHLVEDGRLVDTVPTHRGHHRAFL